MAKHNGKLTPAVSYIRMSSDQQEASPDQQRAEVDKLAKKHNCRILREYYDEAISGDATEKRADFQRMIRDAEEKGDFAAILCWDQDRFGRFDSIEAGRWIYPLRQAGVCLVTVAQGAIDWNDFTGRVMYGIVQEGKHQFLIDLSRNCTRGKRDAMKRGECVPRVYGYDRLIYDLDGTLVRRVSFREAFTRPKGWCAKLVPSEDVEAVETVQWLFHEYAYSEIGALALAAELNLRGAISPRGGKWGRSTVLRILTNQIYLGQLAIFKSTGGKYHQIGPGGEVERRQNGSPQHARRVASEVFRDHHPALVDQKTFDRVASKIAQRRQDTTRERSNRYVLSTILVCGHCGLPLYGSRHDTRYGEYCYYGCYSEKAGVSGCRRKLRQDLAEEIVGQAVEDFLNSPSLADDIRKSVEKRVKVASKAKRSSAPIKARIRSLEQKIAKGVENLALADAADIPALTELLATWRAKRAAEVAKLGASPVPGGGNVNKAVGQAMAALEQLRIHLASADPPKVRAVYKALVERVTLFWKPCGKRCRQVDRVVIQLRHKFGDIDLTSPYSPRPRRRGSRRRRVGSWG